MRLGLLADIHGNASALEAVLSAARARRVDRLLCGGDFVGYYYEPRRCLELLADWNVESVRGNHENMLRELLEDCSLADAFTRRFGSGLVQAAAQLDPAQLVSLADLPATRTIQLERRTVLLCHGAPWDTDEYVYPEASDATFDRCAEAGVDFVVMAHTHCQMAKRVRDSLLINPGSVGQPRRGTGGAEWALLDLDDGTCEHFSESYDSGAVVARARATDPHFPFLQEILARA